MEIKDAKNNFMQRIDLRDEIENANRKRNLAKKLIHGTLTINDLTSKEIDEMIKYFQEYIFEMNQKMDNIKKNIIEMRKK